jgi:mitogen-activated protein kinase kinase kinase
MLTHRLILRVVNYFNESLEVLQHRKMTVVETSRWFNQTLDNVRQRHRKLLRFGK